jgi:acyl-CoA thioesterase FadM
MVTTHVMALQDTLKIKLLRNSISRLQTLLDSPRNLLIRDRWKILAIAFALLNLKSLPFGWHYRLFRPLFRHHILNSSRPITPAHLFLPTITTSRTPLLELDYNMHKSNSTYFSDLDIARSALVSILLPRYFDSLKFPSETDVKNGRWSFALGAVSCHFRREIRAYTKYEMWTRVLSWDRKWLYLVTHIVEAGAVRPKEYLLQPERRKAGRSGSHFFLQLLGVSGPKTRELRTANGHTTGNITATNPAIYATSVARYCFKRGRVTIPVETILTTAGLLPPKPAMNLGSDTPDSEATTEIGDPTVAEYLEASKLGSETDSWDWHSIEMERVRGLKVAECLGGLEKGHEEFTGAEQSALGQW